MELKIKELAALYAISSSITSNLSIEHVVSNTFREVSMAAGPDLMLFYLKQGDRIMLEGSWPKLQIFDEVGVEPKRLGQCLCGIAAQGRVHYSKDIRVDPDCVLNDCKEAGLLSVAALPLKGRDEVLGVITLASRGERDFSEQAPFLETMAAQVAVALQNALFHKSLQKHAEELERKVVELRRTEERLAKSEAHYRRLLDSMNDAVVVGDSEGKIEYVNNCFCRMFGVEPAQVMGRKFPGMLDESNRNRWLEQQETRKRGLSTNYELEILQPGDRRVYCVASGAPIMDEHGRFVESVDVLTDISERKRSLEEKQKLASIIESSSDFIGIADMEGRVIYINEAGRRLIGLEGPESIQGTVIRDYLIEEDKESFDSEIFPVILRDGGWTREFNLRHFTEKEPVPVEMNAFIIKDAESGHPIAIGNISRDLRERRKLEAQLLKAQKMEAVGQLAGGVAHDFNNFLQAIVGYGNILQAKMSMDDPLRGHVGKILSSAGKASRLTKDLLAFGRGQMIETKPADINDLIRGLEDMLRRLIREDVDMEVKLYPGQLIVSADSGQMEQVLLNLATNALDAMPGGGKFVIATTTFEIEDTFIEARGFGKPGQYALVNVSDTGEGMTQKTMEKIFDPFFSTKEVGKGTGLGLSMVYGIVKQHDGYIDVASEVDRGTEFMIYLPLIQSAVKEDKEEALPAPAGGTETILVAEDDEVIRDLVGAMLSAYGYTVIEARDGNEAVDKFLESKDRIRLVVSDVVMPKKSGKEAYDEIRRIKPDVKALFITGYAREIMQQRGIIEGGLHCINKPVSPHTLLTRVRELLDNPDA